MEHGGKNDFQLCEDHLRVLFKNRLLSIVSTISLSIGLAFFILIMGYILPLITVTLVIFSAGFQAFKAARMHPVDSLRHE